MDDVTSLPEALEWLDTTYVSKRTSIPPPPPSNRALNDDELIARIKRRSKKAAALFDGDITGYASRSEADQALVNFISQQTQDERRIDRIFRRSSLMREKWDERRGERTYGEITIATALAGRSSRHEKIVRAGKQSRPDELHVPNVIGFSDFIGDRPPVFYILHRVLQAGAVYSLTAMWGAGKTALMLLISVFAACGMALCGHGMVRIKVLYLCGENPDDVRLRVIAILKRFGIDPDQVEGQLYFTERPFAIDDPAALERFLDEASVHGPFGLVFVDTGPAHSDIEDENDNRQMHKFAMALREFNKPLGNPAVVVAMHPTKGAEKDKMQARGGGAFSGSIDGELGLWRTGDVIEFYHRPKFRGPGFDPMYFELEKHVFPDIVDNFGEVAISIVAVPRSSNVSVNGKAVKKKPLAPGSQTVLDALDKCRAEGLVSATGLVLEKVLREQCYKMGISKGGKTAMRDNFRRNLDALIANGRIRSIDGQYYSMSWPVRFGEELRGGIPDEQQQEGV